MATIVRSSLDAAFTAALERPAPALLRVSGPRGSGVSRALRDCLRREREAPTGPRVWAIAGAAGRSERLLFQAREGLARAGVVAASPDWIGLVDALLDDLARTRRPWIVALDDVADLLAATPAAGEAFSRLWAGARRGGLPLHLVLARADPGAVDRIRGEVPGEFPGTPRVDSETLEVGPVRFDEVAQHLPHWRPRDRLYLHACLGRWPAALRFVDRRSGWVANLLGLVVDPHGPLHGWVPRRLREVVKKPDRYSAILAALADGAQDWGEIRGATPAFTEGNQIAPYLSTLESAGWIRKRASLDASPKSRKRRYAIVDPLVGFWHAVAEPALGELLSGRAPRSLWDSGLSVEAESSVHRRIPSLVREAIAESPGPFPVPARRLGALWGEGYDLDVAGTLRNGAAVYGACVLGRAATVDDATRLDAHMRATRYGFGREGRIRVLFTLDGATTALRRRAARDHFLMLADLSALF
ncbi:MAG: nucleolar 14 family protein [Gemmatimonadetes bacterium]|nr:nucleolar 14 family protein [Gemmatimonadota bacterium]NNF37413.1 hypothetical protein [Gemmatimonadota bacterium]